MSAPDEHLHLPRRLDNNYLIGPCYGMLGVIKLAEMLPQTKLQSLRSAIYVTPSDVFSPAEHLHFARPRRSLRDNELGDEGWTALFKALCENKGDKIESWDLSYEGVGPETAKALAEYIAVSPALKTLKCAREAYRRVRSLSVVKSR